MRETLQYPSLLHLVVPCPVENSEQEPKTLVYVF